MRFRFLAVAGILFASLSAAHANPFDPVDAAILQADGPGAMEALRQIEAGALTDDKLRQYACLRARLEGDSVQSEEALPVEPLAQQVVSAYRDYWRAAVRDPASREAHDRQLTARLRTLINRPQSADREPSVVEYTELSERLKALGYESSWGRTALLLEMMLWRKQEEKTYFVRLPESRQQTTVFIMNDFASEGWARYLSCGSTGTGSWTTDRGLFILASQYPDLVGEEFRVNFLAHEAQHFADQKFGDLPGWRLEYRAKLVELAYVDATREKTLRRFIADRSDDSSIPHSHANKRVVTDLIARLGLTKAEDLYTVNLGRLRRTAVALLRADTRSLRHGR